MFNIHVPYNPTAIRDEIGWADHPTIGDLVDAVMVLCSTVERLTARVAELETAAEERNADEELAFSVALYRPV